MPATQHGERLAWDDLPAWLRAECGATLGSPVVRATPRSGGFSPGVAARLDLADGRRAFVKAVSAEMYADTVAFYRDELAIAGSLSRVAGIPEFLGAIDRDGWLALLFEYVDLPTATLPWRPAELDLVMGTLGAVHEALTPCPPVARSIDDLLGDAFTGWRALAAAPPPALDEWSSAYAGPLAGVEAGWLDAAAGDTLLHLDLRHDNVLVGDGAAWVIDWAWAARGAPFVDAVFFAIDVARHGGPPPGEFVARWAPGVPPSRLAPVVVAMAGFFTERSLRPAPPGLPFLREHQARSAAVARPWAASLLGLPAPE